MNGGGFKTQKAGKKIVYKGRLKDEVFKACLE